MGDDGIESTVLVIGRTAVLDAQRLCPVTDLVLHHLDEARFANPRLPTQYHDMAPAPLGLRPAVPQYTYFVFPSYQT